MRFLKYSAPWYKEKLENECVFYKGTVLSKANLSKNGQPCILYGQLYTTYMNETIKNVVSRTDCSDKRLFVGKANDVIIPASGETPEDISTACCVLIDGVLFGSDLNVIRSSHNGSFLSYQLNGKRKYNIAKLAVGKSIVHLHNEQLKNLYCYFPLDIDEENKIASLLDTVGERIETQNKIIEENKTLKNQLIDTLIYGSSDATCITLSNYCSLKNGYPFKSGCYVEGGKYSIITIGNVQGNRFLNMDGAKTIKSLPLDIQEHQILRKGDILISLTGNVGRVSIVEKDNCLLNQRVGLLTFNDPTITEYVFQCLSSHKFELEMAKKGQGAAQLNIGNDDVTSYRIPISRNNTDSIAKVLKKIDEKIIIEVKLKKLFNEQKKFFLENLFI